MVASLGSDFFIQQVISIDTVTIWTEDQGLILPRVVNYSDTVAGSFDGRQKSGIDAQMAAAISAGLANISSFQTVNVSCPTENCTYPEYSTLGVCSQCMDLSPYLTVGNFSDTDAIGLSGWMYQGIQLHNLDCDNGDCDRDELIPQPFTLSNFTANSPSQQWQWSSEIGYQDVGGIRITLHPYGEHTLTNFTTFNASNIINMVMMNITNDCDQPSWPNCKMYAMECSLSYCEREVQTEVRNGAVLQNFTQRPLSTNGTDSNNIFLSIFQGMGEGQIYTVDTWTLTSLPAYILQSFLTVLPGPSVDSRGLPMIPAAANVSAPTYAPATIQLVEGEPSSYTESIGLLYKAGNLSQSFENLARAMTVALLENYATTNSSGGSIGTTQTVISVRWGWVTPLAIITMLTAICLGTTWFLSRRYKLPPWKAELLPVLLHGFRAVEKDRDRSDEEDTTAASLLLCTAMEDYAHQLRVVLERGHQHGGLMMKQISRVNPEKSTPAKEEIGRSGRDPQISPLITNDKKPVSVVTHRQSQIHPQDDRQESVSFLSSTTTET